MAFTSGSLSSQAVTSVTATLLSTAAVSGTTPYSYQWYRATNSAGFIPAASYAVSGATSLGLTDSALTPSTVYYYKVVSIDSAATPATVSTSALTITTLANQSELPISEVINVSVATTQTGLGEFNTSNLALFSREASSLSGPYKIYLEPTEVADDFGTSSKTYAMALAIFSQQPNILLNGGYLVVIPFSSASETIAAAIARTEDAVQYFGIIQAEISSSADMLAAAAVVQALNKMILFVSNSSAAVAPGGMLDLLRSNSYTQSRGLYYGGSLADALEMMASYAGAGFSVVFEGSNTTLTMNLKTLVGVEADSSLNTTIATQCDTAGVDVYASIQGVAKVLCSGENSFFDQVYNLGWFIGAIQVASFNYLAQTSTKIPQTESGMDGLKGALRQVCEQAVTNQYLAPGSWNNPTTFGNQAQFYQNVLQRGYYIYSAPVSQQSAVTRAARTAPLVQMAIKEAGAIQSASIVIFVNP